MMLWRPTGRYPVQDAGGPEHRELWVPAEDLEALNAGIVGLIEVVARYRDGQQIRWRDAFLVTAPAPHL